jgi:hypothetical protein
VVIYACIISTFGWTERRILSNPSSSLSGRLRHPPGRRTMPSSRRWRASIVFHVPQAGLDRRTFAGQLLEATREARMTQACKPRSGMITAPAEGAES